MNIKTGHEYVNIMVGNSLNHKGVKGSKWGYTGGKPNGKRTAGSYLEKNYKYRDAAGTRFKKSQKDKGVFDLLNFQNKGKRKRKGERKTSAFAKKDISSYKDIPQWAKRYLYSYGYNKRK